MRSRCGKHWAAHEAPQYQGGDLVPGMSFVQFQRQALIQLKGGLAGV